MNLQDNKELVFQSVAQAAEQAQRLKDSVNIIAVTKYVDCETTQELVRTGICLLYTSPSPRDQRGSRMPSSA